MKNKRKEGGAPLPKSVESTLLTNVSTKAQLKTMLPIFDLEHLSSLGAITQNQVQIIESWPDMTEHLSQRVVGT